MSAKNKTKLRPRTHRDRRSVSARYPLDVVYFCVEGKTEVAYIKGLIRHSFSEHFVAEFRGSASKTSLKNLVATARRKPDDGNTPVATWIVCDADQNSQHLDALRKWVKQDPAAHLYAVTDPCMEYWLILHFSSTASCNNSDSAERELCKYLPQYEKGQIPPSVFDRTHTALANEGCRHPGPVTPPGAWPEARSSQMPHLIDWLNEQAKDHERRQRKATLRKS